MMKIFEEFEKHIMEDDKPSIYFEEIMKNESIATKYPVTLLNALVETKQSPEHHPEGSAWIHTLLVLDNAAKIKMQSANPRAFMWGALLHDLGKAPTTKTRKGKITSYDHDKVGAELCREFLGVFTEDQEFIVEVTALVRWHMQTLFVIKDLPFADVRGMVSETTISEIALLSQCDRLGRGKLSASKIKEEKENIKSFVCKCNEILSTSK